MPLAIAMVYCEPSSHLVRMKLREIASTASKCSICIKPVSHTDDLTAFNPLTNWDDFTFPKEQLQEGPHTYSEPSCVSQSDEASQLI